MILEDPGRADRLVKLVEREVVPACLLASYGAGEVDSARSSKV